MARKLPHPVTPSYTLLATNKKARFGVGCAPPGFNGGSRQPKYTSEYIQATSRIGRRCFQFWMGTVYILGSSQGFDPNERFERYHSTLYSHK